MGRLGATNTNSKRKNDAGGFVKYLILPGEPKDVTRASRGALTLPGSYLVRQQMVWTLRRLRGVHPVL